MEKKSHRLSQELDSHEQAVEKKCKAAGLPTPWNRVSRESLQRMFTIDTSNANGCAKTLLHSAVIRTSNDCGLGAIMELLHPMRLRLLRTAHRIESVDGGRTSVTVTPFGSMGKAVAPGRAGQSGQGAPEFFRGGTAGIVSGHQRMPGPSRLLPQAVSLGQ